MRVLPTLLLLVILAGCLAKAPQPIFAPEPTATPMRTSVLSGTTEPVELAAPSFHLAGPIAVGNALYSIGEPSLRSDLAGHLFVAFPGCESETIAGSPPGSPECQHGVVYRSADNGTTWHRLNDKQTGRLSPDGPAANGDAEVAVDAAGTIYASNLGTGIEVQSSGDNGTTWKYLGNVVPQREGADRQWMAAAQPGHLIMAWMGSLGSESRAVIVNTTFDGGATWTGAHRIGTGIGWIGPVVFAPNGADAYVVYTQVDSTVALGFSTCSLRVGHSPDGGRRWEELNSGVKIITNLQGGSWSCVNMAPAMDVTGDGSLALAWSEDINSPGDLTAVGSVVKVVVRDANGTWGQPFAISLQPQAIMPWVAGGAGERFAVTYFSGNLPGDPDYVSTQWDVQAALVDGRARHAVVGTVDTKVHEGGICSRGGTCFLTGSDRFLLDFFQNDVMPDGRLVVVYPANPASGGRQVEMRFAIQDGGSPLFLRSAAAT